MREGKAANMHCKLNSPCVDTHSCLNHTLASSYYDIFQSNIKQNLIGLKGLREIDEECTLICKVGRNFLLGYKVHDGSICQIEINISLRCSIFLPMSIKFISIVRLKDNLSFKI